MTKFNGRPCKKCGTSDWYNNGRCKSCRKEQQRGRVQDRREYRRRLEVKKYYKEYDQRQSVKNYRKAYHKDYRKLASSKAEKIAATSRRRTRKTSAGGSYTGVEWQALKSHYNNVCLKCGRDDIPLTADHVVSVANGGSSNIDNMQPLCGPCNSSKGAMNTDYRGGNFITRWIQDKLF